MTLLEAFRALGLVAEPTQRALYESACERLYAELQDLVRPLRLTSPDEGPEDICHRVFLRLVQSRPRSGRTGDPADDQQVRAYLAVAVRNAVRDLHRRGRRRPGCPEAPAALPPNLEDELIATEEREACTRALAAAEHLLFEVIVPEMASDGEAGARTAKTIRLLRDIRDRRQRMADIVQEEANPEASEDGYRRARNRLDQRFSRALRRLYAEIERRRERAAVSADQAVVLHRLASSLRLRGASEER